MAKLQAYSAKGLSLDLKNLDQRIFEFRQTLDKMIAWLIRSNEELAKAHSKYLFWQNVFTGALVGATVGLIIATLVLAFSK